MPNKDYEVGYGKPPKWHRFCPGQSGNPKGRPKEHCSATALRKAAGKKVKLKGTDGVKWITKDQAIVTQLLNMAMSGNLKAITLYLSLMEKLPLEPSGPIIIQENIIEFV